MVWRWTSDTPDAAAQARAALRCALDQLGYDDETVDNAVLVASEVVTNAVRHATGPYEMRLRRTAAEIICEVEDRDSRLPRLASSFTALSPKAAEETYEQGSLQALPECGRGLVIVHQLTNGVWGFRSRQGAKAAWFAVPLPPQDQRRRQ
ncbi:ATP-binding protein [Streptomyces buecherae]|uniref:ATP-binding protein n=1 Tax=Streptomyces buecherae TaxID=2763006 RepID=UPI00379DA914